MNLTSWADMMTLVTSLACYKRSIYR